MTREEAILLLHDMKDTYDEIHENTNYEIGYEQMTALDMAIEALKAKTDGDIIRRQNAIKAIRSTVAQYVPFLKGVNETLPIECEIALRSVPSAEPKAGECSGCKCLGSYDSDFPCVHCVRKTKDYYCGTGMRGEEE